MIHSRLELLAEADAYEGMAASAASNVLRCRYQSLARYLAILADETAEDRAAGLRPPQEFLRASGQSAFSFREE